MDRLKDKYIPFYKTPVTARQVASVAKILRSGWLTSGPACREFEQKIAEYTGAKYAVAVNSCTAALHLSLIAAGVKSGDEVITTPYTFAASVEAIIHSGARPIFSDIDPDTFNISPSEIEKQTTSRTKAVMPVHIAGLPCELGSIEKLARKNKLVIVHDAAHAIGSAYRGKKIGATPHLTCFSFYATKNITTGEGGMVTTSNKRWADRVRSLSLHGMDRQAWKRYRKTGNWYYEIRELGFKYNLSDINAALGIAQLDHFETMQSQRAKIAKWYDAALRDVDEIEIPPRSEQMTHAWHMYIIRFNSRKRSMNRDQLIDELSNAGVGTSVHFIPIFRQPYYRKTFSLRVRDFPEADRLYKSVITLPLYPGITKAEVGEVVRRMKQIIARHGR